MQTLKLYIGFNECRIKIRHQQFVLVDLTILNRTREVIRTL